MARLVASIPLLVQRHGSAPPVVQRATRDTHLAALRAAVRAGEWQEVATRLNGFNAPDIRTLAMGLSLGEAANTRAAVTTHLAGWPQEAMIVAALDAGRTEVARIGRIYAALDTAIRDHAWTDAVLQLNAMSDQDITSRLSRLESDALRSVSEAAADGSERVARLAVRAGAARGIAMPGVGRLMIGGLNFGPVLEVRPGGDAVSTVDVPLAVGEKAYVGSRPLSDEPIVVGLLGPMKPTPAPQIEALLARIGSTTGGAAGGAGEAVATGATIAVSLASVAVAVLGAAAGAGLSVGPALAIIRARAVADRLAEYGGTLPPGGVLALAGTTGATIPKPSSADDTDEDDELECIRQIQYGPIDDLGRATGVNAMLVGPDSGQRPQEDPAGYVSGISGTEGDQNRAHLLARTLGGDGNAHNLVPFGGSQNRTMYWEIESIVESYVIWHPHHCVTYRSVPVYEGRALSPTQIDVYAYDETAKRVVVAASAKNRLLH